MSVLIKGMEMPTACYKCELYESETYWCRGAKRDVEDPFADDGVATFCPLVPVPPHGRLIDASEKIRVQMYDDMTEDWHIAEMTIDDLLSQDWVEADAPTIIPAEEGET